MTNPRLLVRRSTDDDGPELARLDASAWPVELQVSPPQSATEPFFTEWRRPEDVIVAEDEGVLAGYIRLARHMKIASNDHVLHIDALVVAPDARGRGAGGALVAAAVIEADRRGVAKVGLRALSNNPGAIRLYQKFGFVEEGRLEKELRRPDGSYADDIWMARWLRPAGS